MHSTDLEEIKAALYEQAYHQCTRVSWGEAQVMAVRCRKGQLLALCRGWGRWCPVSGVMIERPSVCPTGACDMEDVNPEEQEEGRERRALTPKGH